MPTRRKAASALPALFTLAALGSGCAGSCHRGTPYVPFLEDSSTIPSDRATTGPDAGEPDSKSQGAFRPVHADLAPPGATRWVLDGLPFEAPPGENIVTALVRDLDGDGQRDVAAYTQPPTGGGGAIRFFRGDGAGGLLPSRPVVGPTGNVEIGLPPPCAGKPAMSLVGMHTIALDLHPACGDATPASRRIAVAAFAPSPSIRWSAKILEPPAGWSLAIEVDAPDRDGDGVDDPTFVFALEGGGPPFEPGDRLVAHVRYWDRPAGLSRDRTEPEASFQLIAQLAAGRASKKSTASAVAATGRRLRMLHSALCAEGGAAWIEVSGDRGLPCGASRALEDIGGAEVRAALSAGDLLLALAARERLTWSAAARIKKTRDEVDRAILGAAPSFFGITRDIKAIPITPSRGAPAWGALAFDRSGAVVVRTSTGVTRVDTNSMDEADAADVASWPWEVSFPGKDARLGFVTDACEAPYLSARISGHDVPTGAALVPLPILPPLGPGRCESRSAPFATTPVAWGPTGLYAVVEYEPMFIPTELTTPGGGRATGSAPAPAAAVEGPYILGAPRSPNGSLLVVPTRFGVVRRDDSVSPPKHAFLRARELEGLYGTLRECAVANDGTRVACLREGKAILLDVSAANADAGSPAE